MNTRLVPLGICLALAPSGAAFAGVTLMINGAEKEKTTIYVEGNKMRVDSERPGVDRYSSMIFDGDAQKMLVVDHEKKTYGEMTKEQLKSLGAATRQRMQESMSKLTPEQRKQMDQMMAQMPPEQRKRMQEMMSGRPGAATEGPPEPKPALKWEPTGERKTIAGFPCQGFKELREGKVRGEGCYFPWDAGAVNKQDFAVSKKMAEFFSQSGLPGGQHLARQEFLELDKWPGFPGVLEKISEEGKRESKWTVASIKRGNVSADKFQPPGGYSKSEKLWGR